jgi:hypothetical protein
MIFHAALYEFWVWGSVVVKALCCKSEGLGIDSRCHRFFPRHLTVPCDLGSTQPLKMSTRLILGAKGGRCVRLTTYHLHVPMSRNLGVLTSWNPVGLFRPVMGQLFLYEFYLYTHGIQDTWYELYINIVMSMHSSLVSDFVMTPKKKLTCPFVHHEGIRGNHMNSSSYSEPRH